MEQQNPDGLPSYVRHQLALHRFFGHQAHGPAGTTLGRIAAHHGNDPLFLVGVQHFSRTGPLLLIEGTIQAGLLITMTEPTDGLWGEWDHLGDLRRAGLLSQLQECQGPQDHPDLLHSTLQQSSQFLLILLGDADLQGRTTHTPSMRQNNSA